jgi:hypothetical protein
MDVVLVPLLNNEVGRALGGVSRSTVYNLIDSGDLKRVNIGHRAFITAESIRAYLDRVVASA